MHAGFHHHAASEQGHQLKPDTPSHSTQTVITDPLAQRKLILALGFSIFFSVLNGTMFNVSIPDIAKQFDLLPSQVSWVVSGYIILFALGSVTYGRLADSHSVKDLITIGLLLFSAGSLIGFAAQWYPMLIVGRMVQASGSGAIPALAMLVTTRYFPGDIKGRAMGFIASTVAFGGAIGPILGGFITGTFHWRYLFPFSMLTLFVIPFLRRFLPDEEGHKTAFDLTGAILLCGAIASLLLFVTVPRWWIAAGCTAVTAWFFAHIRRAAAPFVSPALFRLKRYRNTLIVSFFTVGTVFGMMFMTPLMLRALNGLSAGRIGMTMFPGAMSAAVLGVFGGKLSDKRGGVWVVQAGQGFLIAGFLLLSTLAGNHPAIIALDLVLCYAGFSFLQSSLAHTVSDTLPKEQMGIGMGIYNLSTFLAGAFNAALIGKVLDHTKGHSPINPLTSVAAAGPYSNLFLFLAVIVLAAMGLFRATFRSK